MMDSNKDSEKLNNFMELISLMKQANDAENKERKNAACGIARLTKELYNALKEEGFNEEEAFELTNSLLGVLFKR